LLKIVAITQARTGSTRLPNKILKKYLGKTLLQIHIERIKTSEKVNEIIVATTNKDEDDEIELISKKIGVSVFRGSENNVLDRFYQSVKEIKPDLIVRLTSDCTLIDSKLIDFMIEEAIDKDVDYCSNTLVDTFPDGQDIEIFKFKSLEKAWISAKTSSDKEHVTPFIKKNSSFYNKNLFSSINIYSKIDYKNVRICVDEKNDLKVIFILLKKLGNYASWEDYTNLYLSDKEIYSLNNKILRNEGYYKSLKNDKIK